MIKILVVGGAGFIGSHMVKRLALQEVEIFVLDNLSEGHRDSILFGNFILGDLADREFLDEIFSEHNFDVVMHFASFIQVGESVTQPLKYYENNLINTLNLLNAMVKFGVRNFIFSSTAAIFGEPRYSPIDEKHPKIPINPYGQSKYMVEQILSDYEKAYGIRNICLRYFNAAGADPDGLLGERHQPETHLIPLALQVASGRRSNISVFGRDYDTPDGTCLRDYIHVSDICEAHWLSVEFLLSGGGSQSFNLGNGSGYSVQEVIDAVCNITGLNIKILEAPRRLGDPARLVADSTFARSELGWVPKFPELNVIVQHAWQWERHQLIHKTGGAPRFDSMPLS